LRKKREELNTNDRLCSNLNSEVKIEITGLVEPDATLQQSDWLVLWLTFQLVLKK